MGVVRILCSSGDEVCTYDAEKAEAGDPVAKRLVAEAEEIVRSAQTRGAALFATVPGQPAQRLREFDPKKPEIIVVPRIVGG